MRPHRWPALLVVPLALAGYVVVDRAHEETAPVGDGRDLTLSLEEQGLMPVAAPDTALGTTWYCPGGVVGDDADHTVIVANPSDRDLQGEITVYGDPDSANPVIVTPTVPTTTTAPPGDESSTRDCWPACARKMYCLSWLAGNAPLRTALVSPVPKLIRSGVGTGGGVGD